MSLTLDHRRAKFGADLVGLSEQAQSVLDKLQAIRANLVKTKSTLDTDPDFTPQDSVEAQAAITRLDDAVKAYAAALS